MPVSLQAKLAAARRRWRTLLAAGGLSLAFALLTALALASFWSDRWLILTTGGRYGWLIGLISSAVISLLLLVLFPLRRPLPDEAVAAQVEQAYPALGERLLSTISLARAGAAVGVSGAMVGHLALETERISAPLNFPRAISNRPVRRPAMAAAIAALLLCAHAALAPAAMAAWAQRILHPNADIPVYSYTRAWVSPDDMVVPRGEDVTIGVRTEGLPTDRATLHYRFEGGRWSEAPLDKPKATPEGRRFAFKLTDLQQAVTYYAKAGDGQANPHTIQVEDRPTILNVRLKLDYPAYTGRQPEVVSATAGNVVAPVGTRVEVEATANKPLRTATFLQNGKEQGAWAVSGDKVTGSISVHRDENYGLGLVDHRGFKALTPPQYTVRAQPDQAPQVQISKPGADLERTPNGNIPLAVSATDDYGVSDLRLSYEVGKRTGGMALPGATGAKQAVSGGSWSLGTLGLKAGDTVVYQAVARDNDNVSGAHVGRSSKYQIRIIGLGEMRDRIEAQKQQEQEALKQLIQRQREAQKQLAQLTKAPNKAELSQQAQAAQRSIANDTADLARRMRETSEQMRDNNLGAKSDMERRAAAEQTLSRLGQKQMPAAAESIQKQQLPQAVQQEENARQQLEQLTQQTSPSMNASQLAQEAERLSQEQQKLSDQAALADAQMQSKPASQMTPQERQKLNALAAQQAKLQAETNALQKQIAQSAQEAQEKKQANSADLQSASRQMKSSDVGQKQAGAQQKLQAGQPKEAAPQQSDAARDLQNLANSLDQAAQFQKSAESAQQKADRLEKMAENLQKLAQQQTEAANQIQRNPGKETAAQLAQKERDIQAEAKKASAELSQMPQTQQTLERAQSNLGDSAKSLDQSKSQEASPAAREATRQLLQAASDAQQAAQSERNAQEAREMQHKVEQLAKDQRALEAQTKKLDAAVKAEKESKPNADQQKKAQALAQSQSQLGEQSRSLLQDLPSEAFRWAVREAGQRMNRATQGLQQQNAGADTQRHQENAAQTLERVGRSLAQQSQGEQQQAESGGQQSSSESAMAQAAGELQLAREMQAQIRQETANLNERRAQNPQRNLSADQQRELENLARGQQETQRITKNAARNLKGSPEIGKSVERASEIMEDAHDLLNRQRETNEGTQQKQQQAVTMLDTALEQSRQAMRQQRQQMAQQQSQKAGQKPGQEQQASNPSGNQPAKNDFAPQVPKNDSRLNRFDPRGRGFTGLTPRAQQSMREGRQERVPAEYRDLVNQYYKALSERAK